MSLIFLTGMPCSGKTYWGSRVAAAYNWRYTDLDEYIEQNTGKSIATIFAEEGEDRFRQKEHEFLKDIINTENGNTIIACGGGTPAYYNNTQLMKVAGCVVFLRAQVDTIVERLKLPGTPRPLLMSNENIEETVNELLTVRTPFYEQADYVLPSENISITNFEQIIQSCINRP